MTKQCLQQEIDTTLWYQEEAEMDKKDITTIYDSFFPSR